MRGDQSNNIKVC